MCQRQCHSQQPACCLSSPSCQPPLDLDLPGTQLVLVPSPTNLHALVPALPGTGTACKGVSSPPWAGRTSMGSDNVPTAQVCQHCLGVKCSSHALQSDVVPSAIYHPEYQRLKARNGFWQASPYRQRLGRQCWEAASQSNASTRLPGQDQGPTSGAGARHPSISAGSVLHRAAVLRTRTQTMRSKKGRR